MQDTGLVVSQFGGRKGRTKTTRNWTRHEASGLGSHLFGADHVFVFVRRRNFGQIKPSSFRLKPYLMGKKDKLQQTTWYVGRW